MRDDHFLHGPVRQFPGLSIHIGKRIADIELPDSCLLTLIERGGKIIVATPGMTLQAGDEVAIIGEPIHLAALQ